VSSFQQDFYLETSNPLHRLRRNLRLLAYILRIVWFWIVRGGPVRRAVRRPRPSDDPFFIDTLANP
jgi:hypothetical protein